jgi:dTDP-4-dehydrorhamnose 3,5-epimerase
MNVTPTRIPDVLLVEADVFIDTRGFFMETWHRARFAGHGIDCELVQDNHSRSVQGALRGLHYQVRQPQAKLVRVTAGEVFDVAVDLRKSSPTFGRWVGTYLSADNKRMLWVPSGFGHGFYVTGGPAEVQYKCSDYYVPAHERCIRWDDPELAIEWPLRGDPILSDRDRLRGQPLARADCFP